MTRPSAKGTNEEVAKDRGLNEKIEEMLSIMKEMSGKYTESRFEQTERRMKKTGVNSSLLPNAKRRMETIR